MSEISCQCGQEIATVETQCSTVGCPLSNMPPQDFSSTLIMYPDGRIRPTMFTYTME